MSCNISSVCSPRVGGALCVLVGAVGILIGVLSIDEWTSEIIDSLSLVYIQDGNNDNNFLITLVRRTYHCEQLSR